MVFLAKKRIEIFVVRKLSGVVHFHDLESEDFLGHADFDVERQMMEEDHLLPIFPLDIHPRGINIDDGNKCHNP